MEEEEEEDEEEDGQANVMGFMHSIYTVCANMVFCFIWLHADRQYPVQCVVKHLQLSVRVH